jgi:hypothetical protein
MIPYVREIEFEYGRCDQVSPLIRRVIARNPGPFTYHRHRRLYRRLGPGGGDRSRPGPARTPRRPAGGAGGRDGEPYPGHPPPPRPLSPRRPAGQADRRDDLRPRRAGDHGETHPVWRKAPTAASARCRTGGRRRVGSRLDAGGHDHARPYLQPRLLRAEGRERPVQRRPHHGLVDHGDHPARRRHGRLFRQSREGEGRATSTPCGRPTARRSATSRRSSTPMPSTAATARPDAGRAGGRLHPDQGHGAHALRRRRSRACTPPPPCRCWPTCCSW